MQIIIAPFFGTAFTDSGVSLNAWGAYSGSARMPDNTSTWYTTNDATFEITGVQLEVGSVATDFEHRSFAQELSLCQRYFSKEDGNIYGGRYDSDKGSVLVFHPVEMRATPTMTYTGLRTTTGLDTSASYSSRFQGFMSHIKPYFTNLKFDAEL